MNAAANVAECCDCGGKLGHPWTCAVYADRRDHGCWDQWCDACGGNHHQGGWQACGYVPAAGCEHPACIGRRDTEPPEVRP